jgi:adenosylmethionine-8-amino-7-oxononanoate aminotransferase
VNDRDLKGTIRSDDTSLLVRLLDVEYSNIERGEGVWLTTTDGRRILDACSGGAMVTCLGHAVPELVEAATGQAERIAYYYNHHFTSEPQERLADRILDVAPEMARVRLVSGGSEANETALRLARTYHVERGQTERWRVISPSGDAALEEMDRLIEAAGPETIAAFFCEPVSAAALPGYSPPERFWRGLSERREEYGFLICFDEVVTGIGRVGSWLAAHQLSIEPDIVAVGKGLGAGHAPLGAVLCRQHVYDAIDHGSREFDLGHTWDGTPLSSAVGLAVLDLIAERGLVEHVRERGPGLLEEVEAALTGSDIVGDVRGRGFLLGVELVDPRNGTSFLPEELDAAWLVDDTAFAHGLLVTTTHPQADGYAGDQVLLAPAYTSTDAELAEMVERLAVTIGDVERMIKSSLTDLPAGR